MMNDQFQKPIAV